MRPNHIICSLFLISIILGVSNPILANQWNAIQDGGFEDGTPTSNWNETPGGIILAEPSFAHSGNWVASMGMEAYPTSSMDYFLSQDVIMGTGDSTLQFWLRWEFSSNNNMDYIRAWVDGNVVFEQYADTEAPPSAYQQIISPIGQYPDGLPHNLKFEVHLEGTSNTGTGTLFFLDDVELITQDAASALAADFHWGPQPPTEGQNTHFFDDSTGNPDSWVWDFGDGIQSSLQNPDHVYQDPGLYIVDLTIFRGSDSAQNSIQKAVNVQTVLFPEFSWTPEAPLPSEEVSLINQSTGGADTFFWDFGDGSTSTQENPTHIWELRGAYEVSLTITRNSDESQGVVHHWITVAEELFPEFTWEPLDPVAGQEILFTDTSLGTPDSWAWDFGDGMTASGATPSHVFDSAGSYTVTLTVRRSISGNVDERTVTKYLQVSEAPIADFSWDPPAPEAGEEVYFSNLSTGTPTGALWDFGDGGSSEEMNPTHIFEVAGSYSVSLSMQFSLMGGTAMEDTRTQSITVSEVSLGASFEWAPHPALVGVSTQFTDLSIGDIVDWTWDFGDGAASTLQSPAHIYSDEGQYQVTLQITDSSGASALADDTVEVQTDDLLADFSWSPEVPRPGEEVSFTDLSSGAPLSWNWDFGDDRQANEANPVHRFMDEGEYLVTLTVTYDDGGGTSHTVSKWITVTGSALHADFFWMPLLPHSGEGVEFYDVSRGDPQAWLWDFGDGETSDEKEPTHIFAETGDYDVRLTIFGGADGQISDVMTRNVHVSDSVEIDFSWTPENPKAQEAIRFVGDLTDEVAQVFWTFGDGENSHEFEPTHIFSRAGHFTVQLWAADDAGDVFASVEHQVDVRPPDLQLDLQLSESTPEIGETVDFQITGPDKNSLIIESVNWNFGGVACDDSPRVVECIPSEADHCLSKSFTYSSPGLKGVRVMLQIEGSYVGPLTAAVHVMPSGQCSQAPHADFSWWPNEPMQGQRIRCVDKSSGSPEHWSWSFDDGSTSIHRHPLKIFNEPGVHEVTLEVSSELGTSSITRSISVREIHAECGNSVCEPGESNWNCAVDCGDGEKNSTGRTGRKNTGFAVPAAAGGIPGANGTYWITDGSIINPGDNEAGVILQFYPDSNPEEPMVAGPAILPPHTTVYFKNIVQELFGLQALGGLWIDSNQPIIVNTRTFNQTESGTVGQGIGGISKQDILGENDGSLYLVGLSQNDDFRTNILLQEVTGHSLSVDISLKDSSGDVLGTTTIPLPGGSRWQQRLSALGFDLINDGYAIVTVHGGGKLAVLASKVDQRSGDATTIDSIHRQQMEFSSATKATDNKEHFLVAVVARNIGANQTLWRSELSILNPESESQNVELRYTPSTGGVKILSIELGAGEVFATPDILAQYFPEVHNDTGALHVYSDKALEVSSRTYNLLPTDATVGQSIPGLAEGDMAKPGEVWLLDSLRDDTEYRCNLGFAEFEGNDTEVTVILFDTSGMAQRYLGYRVYSVPAYSQLQVNRIFSDFGVTGDIPQAIGYISVSSEKGAIYGYASIIDNQIGDGTTILAKRQ